jgi:hypothetical protein
LHLPNAKLYINITETVSELLSRALAYTPHHRQTDRERERERERVDNDNDNPSRRLQGLSAVG